MKPPRPTAHSKAKPGALAKKIKMKLGRAASPDKVARCYEQFLRDNPAERIRLAQWESARLVHVSGARILGQHRCITQRA